MEPADAPLRVLYLEDNPADIDLTRRELFRQAPEIRLETVSTLGAALEFLTAEKPDFDIILTDLRLPDGSGLELLEQVRDRDLPLAVVIITGSGDQEAAVAALKAGADDYLVKRNDYLNTLPGILFSAHSRFATSRETRAQPLRVLYAEPSDFDFDLTQRYLARTARHIRLERAGNGSGILERLQPAPEGGVPSYDVLLTDYRLPGMDALDVTKILRRDRRLDIPIVLVTGHGNEEIALQALRLGIDEYLVKNEGYLHQLPAILEKVQKQAALHRSEAKFRELSSQFHGLLDAIPDSITLQSPELRVLWANNGAVAGSKRTTDEVVGMHCYELKHGGTEPCEPCPVLESFRSGGPVSKTVTHGHGSTWELRTIPIREADRVVSVIEVGRDITEHRKLEDQLRHSLKMESIGTLAGGIAHDFNNILTAIIGYGHMALMDLRKDDPRRINVQYMLDGADRAAQLTKDLLLFSRKQISERKPVDLNEIVEKVEKFLKKVIGEDIEYRTVRRDGPIPILADSHQLEQVLMNLVTNARDAMPDGGVLTVSTESVTLREGFVSAQGICGPGRYALITVTDTGTGMDEEIRCRIFEPFFTTKEVGKGTGLGLAVVYGIIRQHEGFIHVYSEPGCGSAFRIYLPLIREKALADSETRREAPPGRGTETILVAEDDVMVRNLAKAVLPEFGYTVIEAEDGEDAVRKFMENRDSVDLLLFDLIMPKMNGKEAFDEIRKIRPEVKAIFASGYATEIVMRKGLLDSGIPLISKPMSPNELARKVRTVLDGVSG